MTRLGIKANVLAAIICIVGAASGYVGTLLIAGYVLLREQNQMLRRVSVKTLVVMCAVSLGCIVVNALPDIIGLISNFLEIFNGSLYIGFISNICLFLHNALVIAEWVMLILMAIMALQGKEFKFAPIDKIVDNSMSCANEYVENDYSAQQNYNAYQNQNANPYQNQHPDNNDITFG